jgi:hypothetical protein
MHCYQERVLLICHVLNAIICEDYSHVPHADITLTPSVKIYNTQFKQSVISSYMELSQFVCPWCHLSDLRKVKLHTFYKLSLHWDNRPPYPRGQRFTYLHIPVYSSFCLVISFYFSSWYYWRDVTLRSSHFWDGNSRAIGPKIPRLWCNPKIICNLHKSPPSDLILSHTNSAVHVFSPIPYDRSLLFPHRRLGLPVSALSCFLAKILYAFSIFHILLGGGEIFRSFIFNLSR